MKTKNLFNTLCFVMIVLAMTNCCGGDNKNDKKQNPDSTMQTLLSLTNMKVFQLLAATIPAGEEELLMSITELERSTAISEIRQCKTDLAAGGASLNPVAVTISVSALASMSAAASHLAPATCTSAITGIEFVYGIDNNKLTIYYKPVVFCKKFDCYNQGGEHFGNYSLIEGDLHTINNGTLSMLTGTAVNTATTAIANYTMVSIKHKTGEAMSPVTADDVTSIIFPMQELYSIGDNISNTDALIFWNALRKVRKGKDELFKHSLVISSNKANDPFGSVTTYSTDLFVNLSHMCPPSCNSATLALTLNN